MTDPVVHPDPPPVADIPLSDLTKLIAEKLTFICPLHEKFLRSVGIPMENYVLLELALVFPPESKLRVRLPLELGDPTDPTKDGSNG